MNKQDFLKLHGEMLDTIRELVIKKNNDYSPTSDPFSNFMLVENLNICKLEEGILVRMCDKISRVSSLLKKDAKVDESIEDTLLDLANYSLILATYIKDKQSVERPEKSEEAKTYF